jgi:hypothetical protein
MKLPDFSQHAGLNGLREQMGMPSANCSEVTDEDYEAIKALTLESQHEGWWIVDRDYLEFLELEDSK